MLYCNSANPLFPFSASFAIFRFVARGREEKEELCKMEREVKHCIACTSCVIVATRISLFFFSLPLVHLRTALSCRVQRVEFLLPSYETTPCFTRGNFLTSTPPSSRCRPIFVSTESRIDVNQNSGEKSRVPIFFFLQSTSRLVLVFFEFGLILRLKSTLDGE